MTCSDRPIPQRRRIRRRPGSRSDRRRRAGRSPCGEARRGFPRPSPPGREGPAAATRASPSVGLARAVLVLRLRLRRRHRRGRHDGHVEADEQPRALGQRASAASPRPRPFRGSLPCRSRGRRCARRARRGAAGSRGSRSSSRPWTAGSGCCSSAGWRSPGRSLDRVDVRLLHPLEELPGVGRQRFDVAALPLGVDGVEGERRLARPAHAGHDDQRPRRQGDVDVLEVVGPGAANDDLAPGVGNCHVRWRIPAEPEQSIVARP